MQRQPPNQTPQGIYTMYYVPRVHKAHIGAYVLYEADFWNSDYRLTPYGLSEVRGLLQGYMLVMKKQEFRGLAPSHIEFSIHNRYADDLVTRLDRLMRDPRVLEHFPVTEVEIIEYFGFMVQCEKRCAKAAQRALSFPKMPAKENTLELVMPW